VTTAVLYGIGAMGSLIARMLADKDIKIVGAIARSPEKVGKDAGVVAGLPQTLDVVVSDDADAVLATCQPDIVVMTIASYMDDVFSTHDAVYRTRVQRGVSLRGTTALVAHLAGEDQAAR
jgi:hypothetical protein